MTTKNNTIKISYYLPIKLPFDNPILNITTNFSDEKIKSLSTLVARPFLNDVLRNIIQCCYFRNGRKHKFFMFSCDLNIVLMNISIVIISFLEETKNSCYFILKDC